MKTLCVVAALMFVVVAPRSAAAQSFFLSPFIDTTLTSPSGSGGASKAGFGLSFGKFGGIIGAETEITYHPQILDNDANALAKSHVFTGSESVMVGPRIANAKPYFVIGAGDLLLNVSSASLGLPNTNNIDSITNSMSNNYFTIDVGGGVMYFFSKRVGARVDLRHFKAYGLDITDLENSGLKFNKFDFWRAGFGAAFAF
jgi:opacity protein-like surface antigen